MYKLSWGSGFTRSYKKWIRNNPTLKDIFQKKIHLLCVNPYDKTLYSHSLTGKLHGKWAIRITWKHRLIFGFSEKKAQFNDCRSPSYVSVSLLTHGDLVDE